MKKYNKVLYLLFFLFLLSCIENNRTMYPEIVDLLDRQYPMFVKTSPTGKKVLLKTRGLSSFDLFTSEIPSSGFIKIDSSKSTQLSLTWNPSGEEIVFQEFNPESGMYDLYQVDIGTKKKSLLGLPSSRNAIPPLKWSVKGKYLAYLVSDKSVRLHIYDYHNDQIIRTVEGMDVYSNFQWMGDSTICFIKDPKNPILTRINLISNETSGYRLLNNGVIKNFSLWGRKVLFVGRNRDEEYFQLYEQNLQNDVTTKLTDSKFNISNSQYCDNGSTFFYNQNENGMDKLYCSDSIINNFLLDSKLNNGSLEIDLALKNMVYLKHSPLEFSPSLVALDMQNLTTVIKYAPHHAGYLRLKKPEFIEIQQEFGSYEIPCFFWKADYMGIGKKTIIYVHGGPFLQSKPLWDARIKLLTEFGFNVLSINYRGSSGYSKKFSELHDESAQVHDVLTSIRWLRRTYSILPKDIVLVGSSFGGKLALGAIDKLDNIGGVVLVSGGIKEEIINLERLSNTKLIGFYGEYDPLAKKAYDFFNQNSVLGPNSKNFKLLNAEGHNFHKNSSWADVYGTIISVFSDTSNIN